MYKYFSLGDVAVFQAHKNSTDIWENPVFTNASCNFDGDPNTKCEYGTLNNFQVSVTKLFTYDHILQFM